MSAITEVTTEAFEKLNIKTMTLKQKQKKKNNRFTNQIKQDTKEVNKF